MGLSHTFQSCILIFSYKEDVKIHSTHPLIDDNNRRMSLVRVCADGNSQSRDQDQL